MRRTRAHIFIIFVAGSISAGCKTPPKAGPPGPVSFLELYKMDYTAPWIGVKAEGVDCQAIIPPAQKAKLTSQPFMAGVLNKDFDVIRGEGNKRFCTFRVPDGVILTDSEVESLVTELGKKVVGLRPDVPILGGAGLGAPEDDERLWLALALRGLLESDAVFQRPFAGKKAQLWVLDDVPDGYKNEHSFEGLKSPSSVFGHGLMVAQVASDVACGVAMCEDPPMKPIHFLPALSVATTGGPSGSLTDLSQEILVAALSPTGGVVNLSLGWYPVVLQPTGSVGLTEVYPAIVTALEKAGPAGLAALPQLNDGPTAQVFWSLLRLSCSGAVAIAGAGNDVLLHPAAFGAVPVTEALCNAVGVDFDPEDLADPRVVYTVGGLDFNDKWVYPPPETMVGHEQVPSFAALGTAATRTPRGGWQVSSGASIAAATISGAVALQWRYQPEMDVHWAVEGIRDQGITPAGELGVRPRLCAAVKATMVTPPVECNEVSAAEVDAYVLERTQQITSPGLSEGPLPWAPVGPIQRNISCYKCK